MIKIVVYTLLTVFLTSCSAEKNSRDFVGKYTSTFLGFTDTLIVNSDGTYEHVFIFKNVENKNIGKWEVEIFPFGESGLTFYDFTFRDWMPKDPNKTILKPPGIWHVKPDHSLIGGIKMCFFDDLG